MSDLEIRMLGPFEVLRSGRRVDLTRPRLRDLLGVLALSGGLVVPVEVVGDRLWGEGLPARLRPAVQTLVSRLRRLIGSDAVVARGDGYCLAIERTQVDVLRFLDEVEAASGAAPGAERDQLAAALELWRGTPFSDLGAAWFHEAMAPALEDRRLAAIERRIDLDLPQLEAGRLVADLRELVAQHPLREPLWQRLIGALDAAGRRAEALSSYEQVRVLLATELGVDPGPALRSLHAELLAADADHSPEPVVGPAMVPHQLPPDNAHFSGRDEVLRELDDLLSDVEDDNAPTRIVALCGNGGVGKTTLAVHWAHRVGHAFRDGQLYLNLHGYGPVHAMPPSAALKSLLRALGVADHRIPDGQPERTAMLRTVLAGRRMLLVLDNARDADQVRPLFPGTGCLVLITSRRRLRSLVVQEGASRITVEEMTSRESAAMLESLVARLSTQDLRMLAELCGHLPLALAIAAEQVNQRPGSALGELVERLRTDHSRLDAFDDVDDASDLRAVFSWSFETLPADAARMFQLLGLHPGPHLDAPAAAALAGADVAEARTLLQRLADLHLVVSLERGRFEMHDLVREYAADQAERLSTADVDAASSRMYRWYLHSIVNARDAQDGRQGMETVEPPGPDLEPMVFASSQQALEWFDRHHATLLAIVRESHRRGEHRFTHGMVMSLFTHLMWRRDLDVLGELLGCAREAARHLGDRVAEAVTENLTGLMWTDSPELDRSLAAFDRAYELFSQEKHDVGRARVLGNLAVTLADLGRAEDAIGCHEESLAIKRRLRDDQGVAATLNNLAVVLAGAGRGDEAVGAARDAQAYYQEHGLERGEAIALDSLGVAECERRNFDQAIDHHRHSIRLHRELGDRWGEGVVLTNLGRTYHAAGMHEQALASWQEALELHDRIDAGVSKVFNRAELEQLIASVASAQRR